MNAAPGSAPVPNVRRNIVLLYGANIVAVVTGFLATPLYLHYLGIEAYGVTGLLATLMAWFTLLDLGLGPALGRAVTQHAAGTRSAASLWSIVRGLERIYAGVAVASAVTIVTLAPWAAWSWLRPERIGQDEVATSLALMGVIVGLRLWCGFYHGGISGFQAMPWLSGYLVSTAVIRLAASGAVLAWIQPSLTALMLVQALLGVGEWVVIRGRFQALLPREGRNGTIDWMQLRELGGFSAGVAGTAVVAAILANLDKVVLSRLLTLEQFGGYMLAITAASVLYRLLLPVYYSVLPRLTVLAEQGDELAFTGVYHRACQMVTVLTVPAALVLGCFPEAVLMVWTGHADAASQSAGVLRVLAFATLAHALVYIPNAAQLAHGWTALAFGLNLAMCVLLVPAMIVGVSWFGAMAAALVWLTLNLVGLVTMQVLMTRRILCGEAWPWFAQDVLPVVVACIAVALVLGALLPGDLPRWAAAVELLAVGVTLSLVAVAASPLRIEVVAAIRAWSRR